MKTKTYKVNLRGFDTQLFARNPIVVLSFSQKVVGRASIHLHKRWVTVEYMDRVPEYKHIISPAYLTIDYGNKQLINLSVVPSI